jgi:hypothetical protein
MPSLHEAQLRHASYFLELLREADKNYYIGHDALKHGLKLLDTEWGNIQVGQAWAKEHSSQDDIAATVCINYPYWGAHILDLRQSAKERLLWSEAALGAAHRLKDKVAEA